MVRSPRSSPRSRLVVAGAVVLALAFPSGAWGEGRAGAKGARQHVVTVDYLHPNGVDTSHGMVTADPDPLLFQPRAGDHQVRFDVADAGGRNVILYVTQEDGSGESQPIAYGFCGYRSQGFPLVSNKPVEVLVYHGLCANHQWSYASSGTIDATFSTARVEDPAAMVMHHHGP